jgi:hypothetical protein
VASEAQSLWRNRDLYIVVDQTGYFHANCYRFFALVADARIANYL